MVYIKSLGWGKEDVKKILLYTIMLLIGCFVINNFVIIKTEVEINQGTYNSIPIRGRVETY
jgi:hypothetical protein